MRIYNLFPLLAGPVSHWRPHLERAADLGFNWIFVNPIQKPGRSGSLYSIKDYFQINPALADKRSDQSPDDQIREMVGRAEDLGLRMMQDLVINHCAYDSPLLKEHPQWFVKEKGRIAHPSCMEDGKKVVWRDLASFDHRHTSDPEGLYRYCRSVVDHLIALGFKGFRCDAAYQIPAKFWRKLIGEVKRAHPEVVFIAETLGCSVDETTQTASAGFDYIYNSSKYWDFSSPWLMEQYDLTRDTVPSIGFPESHDTPRLYAESGRNVDALKQRYLFSALFSAGAMMPIGYEFGFEKPLHVVNTKPRDWEQTEVDISDFIRHINHVKSRHRVFQEESITQIQGHPNPAILLLWKAASQKGGEALIILNKNLHGREYFYTDDLYQYIQSRKPLHDLSPQWALDYLPTPFEFELAPGMGRILVTS
ncbi:MAG: alpha-amylase family glycosyl hydrolase [Methylohalobius crimeensis]